VTKQIKKNKKSHFFVGTDLRITIATHTGHGDRGGLCHFCTYNHGSGAWKICSRIWSVVLPLVKIFGKLPHGGNMLFVSRKRANKNLKAIPY